MSHFLEPSSIRNYINIIKKDLESINLQLKKIIDTDIKNLEKMMEHVGAPHTPGRISELK